jgi:hypothetical protein
MSREDLVQATVQPAASEGAVTGPSSETRETIVFAFDTKDQRDKLFSLIGIYAKERTGLRIVALSMDNEVTRVGLMYEATERYSDPAEAVEAIEALYQCEDLVAWSWTDYDNGTT